MRSHLTVPLDGAVARAYSAHGRMGTKRAVIVTDEQGIVRHRMTTCMIPMRLPGADGNACRRCGGRGSAFHRALGHPGRGGAARARRSMRRRG